MLLNLDFIRETGLQKDFGFTSSSLVALLPPISTPVTHLKCEINNSVFSLMCLIRSFELESLTQLFCGNWLVIYSVVTSVVQTLLVIKLFVHIANVRFMIYHECFKAVCLILQENRLG